jgi:adenosylcobinamide-GDP ribazoletransferase
MTHEFRLFLVALQFLTRLPVPALREFDPAWLHASARWFPAVGLVVGGLIALALWGAALLWPPALAVVLALGLGIALTGAFHEDGLADTWDALGGVVPRERALLIMKDSRLGSYGALALGVGLAAKALALHAVVGHSLALALVALPLVHAWARAGTVVLIAAMRYGGDEAHAKAKPLARTVRRADAAIAVGLGGVALGLPWLAWPAPAVALAALGAAGALALLVVLLRGWLRRRLGGYTGDTLGACEQLGEIAVALALLAGALRAGAGG